MEWLLPIGPFKRFSHSGIEILYKSQHTSLQMLHRGETGTPQELPHQNTEPQLNLVHPRRMFWGVVEHDAMGGIGQKRRARAHRPEQATLALAPQVVGKCIVLGDQAYQAFGLMNVEIVDNKMPARDLR